MERPLTTNEVQAKLPALYRKAKGPEGKAKTSTMVCALIVDPTKTTQICCRRFMWSELLAARLRAVASAAASTGNPEGKSLPYASLRATLQVQIPETILLAHDLGAPWSRAERSTFLEINVGTNSPTYRAAAAVMTWTRMVLKPWAERVGVSQELISGVQELCKADTAFTVTDIVYDLAICVKDSNSFEPSKRGILQLIGNCLEGKELFPGLGPVYRIIRSRSTANSISFQTWPATTSAGGRFSMVATLQVETAPFVNRPIVTITASRRRWYDTLPSPKRLFRLRTLSGTIMGKGAAPTTGNMPPFIAVEFTTPVKAGEPAEPCSPEFMVQALQIRHDLAATLPDMIARQGRGGVFMGVPYAAKLGGSHIVGSGASTRDEADLFDAVLPLLAEHGFHPMPFVQTPISKRAPRRADEYHAALKDEGLIADIALSLGRNDLGPEAMVDACRKLMAEGEIPEIDPDTAAVARASLETLRSANQERVQRAFGVTKPTVALIARTERERDVMRACLQGLFGHSVNLCEYALPANVHGARADMPKAEAKAKERFAARVEGWRPLTEALAENHKSCHVLVQATDRYLTHKDDPVNKLAGRYSLASRADANVQYLRPPAPGWRGLKDYLHRIQAGIYDLLFGHSGLVSEIDTLIKSTFQNRNKCPAVIIGFSVVSQARVSYGGTGGQLCVATRIDQATGQTTARLGWFDQTLRWTPCWEPFASVLKRIASPDIVASLGTALHTQRETYQKFLRTIIDESAADGENPLVLIDSTSAARLWPWLTDKEIGGPIILASERIDTAARWPGVRIVRIRAHHAARIVERKSVRYEKARSGDAEGNNLDSKSGDIKCGEKVDRYCPAIVARMVRVNGGNSTNVAHYWVTHGYFQMLFPRGLSVYRILTSFYPAKKEKTIQFPKGLDLNSIFTEHQFDISKSPYRLPSTLEITVALCDPKDNPDLIGHLVSSLRCGYGHTASKTTLPAPLSFETKARDYMTRFALDEADALLDIDGEDIEADTEDSQIAILTAEIDQTDVEIFAVEMLDAATDGVGQRIDSILIDQSEAKTADMHNVVVQGEMPDKSASDSPIVHISAAEAGQNNEPSITACRTVAMKTLNTLVLGASANEKKSSKDPALARLSIVDRVVDPWTLTLAIYAADRETRMISRLVHGTSLTPPSQPSDLTYRKPGMPVASSRKNSTPSTPVTAAVESIKSGEHVDEGSGAATNSVDAEFLTVRGPDDGIVNSATNEDCIQSQNAASADDEIEPFTGHDIDDDDYEELHHAYDADKSKRLKVTVRGRRCNMIIRKPTPLIQAAIHNGVLWSHAPKAPVLPLPPFITKKWLADQVSAPPSVLREIHHWRAEVKALSGFPWPSERPNFDQFIEIMVEGLRYPAFLRAITRVGARHKTQKKRWFFRLLNPLVQNIEFHIKLAASKQGCGVPEKERQRIKILIDEGFVDYAVARIYFVTLGAGYETRTCERMIEDYPEALKPIVPFMHSAIVHMQWDFDWTRDIIDQYGAPIYPPHDDAAVPAETIRNPHLNEGDEGRDDDSSVEPEGEEEDKSLFPIALTSETDAPITNTEATKTNNSENNSTQDDVMPGEKQVANLDTQETTSLPSCTLTSDSAPSTQEDWTRELSAISDAAKAFAQSSPSPSALAALIERVRIAEGIARAWEDAQPKYTDPSPMIAEAISLAKTLASVTRTIAPEVPDIAMVTLESAEAAGYILDDVRVNADRTTALITQAREVSSDFDRLEEALALKKESQTTAGIGLVKVVEFGETLREGAAPEPTTPQPLPPQPPTSPTTPTPDEQIKRAGTESQTPQMATASANADGKSVAEEDVSLTSTLMGFEVTVAESISENKQSNVAVDDSLETLVAEEEISLFDEMALGNSVPNNYDAQESKLNDLGSESSEVSIQTWNTNIDFDKEAEEIDVGKIDDQMAEPIDRRIIDFVTNQDYGMAFHLLRAGQRVFPYHQFQFTLAELRLAATAAHINHSTMQLHDSIQQLMDGVLEAAMIMEENKEDISDDVLFARRILMFSGVCCFALFHPDTVASQILEELGGVAPGFGDYVFTLSDALVSSTRTGQWLTPAMLRTLSRADEGNRDADAALRTVQNRIEAFASRTYTFQLGNKIRIALMKSDMPVGYLRDTIALGGNNSLDAARAFAKDYHDRQQILTLLDEGETAANNHRVQGIDGFARESMVAYISEIVATCNEYVQARDAAPALKNAGHKSFVQNLRAVILSSLPRARAAIENFSANAAPLPAASANFALTMMDRLRAAVDGNLPTSTSTDPAMALHGALLWVPRLTFGRSWLPSPYQPDIILSVLLASPPPAAPKLAFKPNVTNEMLDAEIKHRLMEDSFIGAKLLAASAPMFGIGADQQTRLTEEIDAEATTRRDKLTSDIAEVRRMVDRIQRMGMLMSMDEAQGMLSLLDRITPADLPEEVNLEARDEDEDSEFILDFASAEAVLTDVRSRLQRLLDAPRRTLLDKLTTLASAGKVAEADADRVRGLISQDDLLTAGEFVGFLEYGRALPETCSPNPRFAGYFPKVPQELAKIDKKDLARLRDYIDDSKDFGPLAFSNIPERRREEARELLMAWKELQCRVQGGRPAEDVMTEFVSFLEKAGISVSSNQSNNSTAATRRRSYSAELGLRIPTDDDSVLLPDFGSATAGNYRVCVIAKMPSESELSAICSHVGKMGVVVFVMEKIDVERRNTLARDCISQTRRVLIIDESMFLFALTEAEFRPLTMFELAQPFSYAAPYMDYGNAPVPPEMFYGRTKEISRLFDSSGSCIVYGGRRLGKSALLQHITAKYNLPSSGTAVAYVNIQTIGGSQMPNLIWEVASRELPAIFKEPATTANDFCRVINAWLAVQSHRRVLILFDEADRFIETDELHGFIEFTKLQKLMDSSTRRFKFVLAGLHNVTRLVHTENPPLAQIAADPQRIGPLMDKELRDAEMLVTRPLAGIGYDFENREDVWAILSHCNYYPVLAQTFCKGLLNKLDADVVAHKKQRGRVSSDFIREALEDEDIIQEIGKMFDFTIGEIEARYALIANIIAQRSLNDQAAGRVEEGMTAVDVLSAACRYWPAAFKQGHRLSTIEDLLDELDGMGILRRVSSESWALRSYSILRRLGSSEKISAKLQEFLVMPPPAAYEPRSLRRPLRLPKPFGVPDRHYCPLTLGQEHDLLTKEASGQAGAHVRIIFGSTISDITHVPAVLRTAGPLASDGSTVEIIHRAWTSIAEIGESIKSYRHKDGAAAPIILVDQKADWNANWVAQVLVTKAVKEGRVRICFVGGPNHALKWVASQQAHPLPPKVKVMALQGWSTQMINQALQEHSLAAAQYCTPLLNATGGFNRTMSNILVGIGQRNDFTSRMEMLHKKVIADPELLADMGLIEPMRTIFRGLITMIDSGLTLTPYEIDEAILKKLPEEIQGIAGITGDQVTEFGELMNLLSPEPLEPGGVEEYRNHTLNPLLIAALRNVPEVAI